MRVDSLSIFQDSLRTLRGRTHGDTLAIYLGLKYHQNNLPIIGDGNPGVASGALENLLDFFYTKRVKGFQPVGGEVCRIFQNSFTPPHSNSQNNWRDFFRYGLGVGCMASELELSGSFLWQHRSDCKYLTKNSSGFLACDLHPIKTRYIRGLDKPKLMKWVFQGSRGAYKLVDLNNLNLLEVIRPLSIRIPLESLLVALYFGAPWSSLKEVTVDQFASDFHFNNRDQVEYLFAVDIDDPLTRAEIDAVTKELKHALVSPFKLTGDPRITLTIVQRKIRTRAFVEAVREAYDRSCAVCGLRLDTPSGKWEVQAAHIYPRKLSGSDDIRNGLSLCHNHHWAFDEHVFTIDKNYELKWHSRAKLTAIFVSGSIKLPARTEEWPNQDQALAWHRAQFNKKQKH
jgi:hypothetical protein